MRLLALFGALAAFAAVTTTAADAAVRTSNGSSAKSKGVVAAIDHYRTVTWRWQRVMHVPRTRSSFVARKSPDAAYRRWVLRLWKRRAHRVEVRAAHWLDSRTAAYRDAARHWERVIGSSSGPLRETAAAATSLQARLALMRNWKRRANDLEIRAANPPYESAWLCIHRYEGSWTDSGAPYYGGLQMDIGFQQTYGSYLLATKGTADNWTPAEQMWVAARAHMSGRGFYPWPNTARACGLI
jgi:hypothetical protein